MISTGRRALVGACVAGLAAACGGGGSQVRLTHAGMDAKRKDKDEDDEDVGAVEDLMREHGVLRRILVVYRESAPRLRDEGARVVVPALLDAATLMRTFGEDYHEKALEEAHVFPIVRQAGGSAATELEPLLLHHQRGREITDYVLAFTRSKTPRGDTVPLARALEQFCRMYEEHTAREDTIVFPAWKKALSKKDRAAQGELFEDIEHRTFGKDGFEDAVAKMDRVERTIGLDAAAVLAPPPPR